MSKMDFRGSFLVTFSVKIGHYRQKKNFVKTYYCGLQNLCSNWTFSLRFSSYLKQLLSLFPFPMFYFHQKLSLFLFFFDSLQYSSLFEVRLLAAVALQSSFPLEQKPRVQFYDCFLQFDEKFVAATALKQQLVRVLLYLLPVPLLEQRPHFEQRPRFLFSLSPLLLLFLTEPLQAAVL